MSHCVLPSVEEDTDKDLHSDNRRHHSNREKLSPVTAYPRAAEIYTRGVIQRRIHPRGEEPSAPECAGTLQTASRVARETTRLSAPSETKHIVRI